MRIRASDLAALFEVYIIATGLGALKTALDTTGPWYRATATFWALSVSFLGGLVLLGVLVLSALHFIQMRPPERALDVSTPSKGSMGTSETDMLDQEMEELLRSVQRAEGQQLKPKEGTTTLLETADVRIARAAATPTAGPRSHAGSIPAALKGPVVATAVFTAISAAFLPASDGMLQTNFSSNTFLILLLAYGWGGLIAYAVASVFLAARGG